MINKQPTIDDIYNFDAYISTPGVREGLMQRATLDDAEFTVEDTDAGQAMYFNAPHGEQLFVGMKDKTGAMGTMPGDIQLAEVGANRLPESAYSGQTLDTFTAPNYDKLKKGQFRQDTPEMREQSANAPIAALRGWLAGTAGLPGDIEHIVRLLVKNVQPDSYVGRNLQPESFLPTSEFYKEDLPLESSAKGPVGSFATEAGSMLGGLGTEAIAKGIVKTGTALAPKAAEMAANIMERGGVPIRGLNIVEPSKFNPKIELPKAVDIVANDPALSIYLPQAQRAPSVALRLAKPEIQGTGEKGVLTVADIGVVLEKSQLALNKGKTLDPTKPKDLVKMVDSATAEAEYQMSQPISGATWYEDDVFQAFALGAKIVPELATDEPLRVMATAFAASTSYNKRASENWSVAMRITEDLMKTNKVPSRNPDNGKLWGGTTGPIMEQQLNLHQFMINKMGMDGYAKWLLTPHTVKEIVSMKEASGLYKSPSIPGKATDMKMGSFIMGEKGGAFFLNLNGIKETTADKWFTRTYNRHTGTLTSGNVSEQGLIDAPRNESERSVMKVWNRSVANNMGLDEQANQAVLWYYEQSLYYNLGIKSARSESFSDGAKNLLNTRGIPFTDAELAGARGRSNGPQTGAEPQSPTGAGDTVSFGQVAPVQPAATPTSVTGGLQAPQSGVK